MRIFKFLLFTLFISSSKISDAKVEEHGLIPEKEKIEKIEVGQSPADVLQILGSPSFEDKIFSEKNEKKWYYIKDIAGTGIFGAEYSLEGSIILVITFKNNKVESIREIDLKNSKRKIRNSTLVSKPEIEAKESGFDINDIILLRRM